MLGQLNFGGERGHTAVSENRFHKIYKLFYFSFRVLYLHFTPSGGQVPGGPLTRVSLLNT